MTKEKVKKAVWIEGSVERKNGNDIDMDELNIEFIKFIENKGMTFCGVFRYMTKDEI